MSCYFYFVLLHLGLCIVCVALLMDMFVLCAACCKWVVKQFARFLSVVVIFLLNVMEVSLSVGGVALLHRPCMVYKAYVCCACDPRTSSCVVVVVYPLPCLWGESDHPTYGPPASLSLHMASSSITPAGSVRKSRGDNVVHMWVS